MGTLPVGAYGTPTLSDEPVVKPGDLPINFLNQDVYWVDADGYLYRVTEMTDDFLLWSLDWLLANARSLRDAWAAALRESYDASQKARRWMLNTELVFAFMRALVVEEDPSETEHRLRVALRRIETGPTVDEFFTSMGPASEIWAQHIAREALHG